VAGYEPLPEAERRARAAALAPVLRGLASTDARQVGHFSDSDVVLDFLSREKLAPLAALGTSCPDHFLRTKVRPLVVDLPATATLEQVLERLPQLHAEYREAYRAYYERHATPDSPPMRGADPAIVLVPGVGMFSYGKDKQTARVAGEFYTNAINVMRGAEAVSTYAPDRRGREVPHRVLGARGGQAPADAEAQAAGDPRRAGHRRRVGHRQGHRRAPGRRGRVRRRHRPRHRRGAGRRRRGSAARTSPWRCPLDVTDEAQVADAVAAAALAFGGVDLVVNNAGLSVSKPLLETTAADWDLQHDVMAKGSFLVSREAARAMVAQAMGGDVVYISSKNSVFAGPNNVAYGATKADQAHQVRLLAAELGEHGIRVNGVNPDGVVRGSGIFASGWGAKRAAVYGVPEEELGAFYAQRTLLKREVLPEHIAAAVFALTASDLPLTTGLHVPVDGGVAAAFLR
jgi:NAD(P)-dependent dehydrogenase (short-subunit alcohol dehydrogenase family)